MKVTYCGTEKEARALGTYVKLMRAADSLTARIHRHLADADLTLSQFGTLEALYHCGPMTQVEIGRKILKSGGNITLVVDNLEKRGLVRRDRGSTDRRQFTVRLTDEGKKLVAAFFPAHAKRITDEMEVLTPAEQEQLGRLCKKLGLGKKQD